MLILQLLPGSRHIQKSQRERLQEVKVSCSYISQYQRYSSCQNRRDIYNLTHELLACLLIVQAIGPALSARIGCVVKVNRFLTERLRQLLQGAAFFASKEKHAVAIPYDRLRGVLVNRLQLALGLQYDRGRDFAAAHGREVCRHTHRPLYHTAG